MGSKDDTTSTSLSGNQTDDHVNRPRLQQAIEAERLQLLQAHAVIHCLYEVLLHAEGDDAIYYAEAAYVALCRFHHRVVHEGGVRIEVLDDGALRFVRRDGRAFDSVAPGHTQPLGNWQRLPEMHREQGIHIDKTTGAGRWNGDHPDYDLGILVLLQQARRAKSQSVSAEMPAHVPAETAPRDTVHPCDIVWASIEDNPLYQEEQARIAERQRKFVEEDRYYRLRERQKRSRITTGGRQ